MSKEFVAPPFLRAYFEFCGHKYRKMQNKPLNQIYTGNQRVEKLCFVTLSHESVNLTTYDIKRRIVSAQIRRVATVIRACLIDNKNVLR